MTVATCVCCSMISDTQTAYPLKFKSGSAFAIDRQGKVRQLRENQSKSFARTASTSSLELNECHSQHCFVSETFFGFRGAIETKETQFLKIKLLKTHLRKFVYNFEVLCIVYETQLTREVFKVKPRCLKQAHRYPQYCLGKIP
jgi:hypothetical protein